MLALGVPQNQRAAARSASRGANSSPQASGADKKEATRIQKYLTDCRSFYSCLSCRAHLANHDELISRSFQGNRSRAYLFNSVINITTGQPVQRELNTGSHAVADIFCSNCNTTIGWKYERAYVDSQKYKEGKFIIELAHVVRENRHLELDKRDMFLGLQVGSPRAPPSHETIKSQATIGELHRGSLSPPSHSGDSRWSSATSSSSSNEDSSSPLAHDHRHQNHHHNHDHRNQNQHHHLLQQQQQQQHTRAVLDCDEESSDEEEEEVLMFPFHDDLYGERASYSSSSASRLSYTKRFRRSMRQDSAPYDWKYSTRPSTSLNLDVSFVQATSSTSLPTPLADSVRPAEQAANPSRPISGSASSARTATTQAHDSYLGSGAPSSCQRSKDDQLGTCESLAQSSSQNCDQSMGQQQASSSRCGASDQLAPSGLRDGHAQDARELRGGLDDDDDQMPRATSSDSPMISSSSGKRFMEDTNLVRSDSLSLDDEEFYDCCTDHQVSNSSSSLAPH